MQRYLSIALLTLVPGCGPLSVTIGSAPEGDIEQTVVQDGGLFVPDRVAIIDISGLLLNGPVPGILSEGENPVGYLHERLQEARADKRIKAVILRLNTPGGTVTASDAMYREVKRFREMSGKPVIAMMLDVAASGGYYTACAADRILAYPTSVTGSIGVIMQTFSVKGLLDRWDIRTDAIISGPNKDLGSPLSHLSADERAILQSMVDEFYGRFVSVVRESRPRITPADLATATDGRVFTGEQAVKLGLIDATGDLYDAFAAAKELAGLDRADLVLVHREGTFAGSIYSRSPQNPATQINFAQINLEAPLTDPTRTFLYLWQP